MSIPSLRAALAARTLRELDCFFAERITRNLIEERMAVALAAALVSHAVGDGDVCVDLTLSAGKQLFSGEGFLGIQAPPVESWRQILVNSPVVGGPGEIKPLVLDRNRLYLGRYWVFEDELAERLRAMSGREAGAIDHTLLRDGLSRLFPGGDGAVDWQRVAAGIAVLQSFSVISGGPGTGKTHTVTAILALLIEQAHHRGDSLRVALAAPTGKAAARLTESIRSARETLDVTDDVRNAIPDEAQTLHRLIAMRPGRALPGKNRDNPLHLDLLVIDEASMIDLPLMHRTLAALPEDAGLIMLGDKDQLASVEAGSLFGDLCGSGTDPAYSPQLRKALKEVSGDVIGGDESSRLLGDNIAHLKKSYRFGDHSGIGNLARAVNAGDAGAAKAVLESGGGDITWENRPLDQLKEKMAEYAVAAFSPVMASQSAEEALKALGDFRILCAVRRGPAGVELINHRVEQALERRGVLRVDGEYYPGRPIMVTGNDYHLGLFNGDIGILWPDPDSAGALRAWFRLADGSLRRVAPNRLPRHETAFALTVHKAQGSEFSRVLLLLPENDSAVLTRELLYTGITRAAQTVELWAQWERVAVSIGRTVARTSGLMERLNKG